MTVRLASADEAGRLAAIHASSFREVWSEAYIAALMATPGAFALLVEGVDGFVLMRVAGDEAEVLTLAVAPAARRRGHAIELVTTACVHAVELGASAIYLEVDSTNLPALALYKRLGFLEVGRRKGYYAGEGGARNDALVLRGTLPLPRVCNPMQLG